MANIVSSFFSSPLLVFTAAFLLRAVLLVYGLWQDANSPLKYTDIDYLVFTDAARFTFSPQGVGSSSWLGSPYARETYRYTPLLAWLLYPTTWPGVFWFSFGKVLFAAADLAAGWLLVRVLVRRQRGMDMGRALRFASIWLLNPMVATISTRGSSEGLLGVLVAALLCAVLERRVVLAGLLLGFSVHFKIYPFIYAPAIVWWMDAERMEGGKEGPKEKKKSSATTAVAFSSSPLAPLLRFLTPDRIHLAAVSLATFAALNAAMYVLYGHEFLQHTFLHHVTRIDHRHNFSPYNVLLYLESARPYIRATTAAAAGPGAARGLHIESVAFLPQLLLSCVLIPLVGAKKDLPATMLAQTFAFVTFNKVCTSQVCSHLGVAAALFSARLYSPASRPPSLLVFLSLLPQTYFLVSPRIDIALANPYRALSISSGTWSSSRCTCQPRRCFGGRVSAWPRWRSGSRRRVCGCSRATTSSSWGRALLCRGCSTRRWPSSWPTAGPWA
jgi:GPI mannosyltransferase 1 subunit M